MRIYLDTNVFISLFQEEMGRGLRGLNIEARDFFERAKQRKDFICISSLFFQETKKVLFMDKNETLEKIKEQCFQIILVKDTSYEETRIFKELGIHTPDYIHAAIAYKNCDCIVTFNTKDFKKAAKFIPLFSPNDL